MNDTAALLGALVRVDSSNPPGNEAAVARVLSRWLQERGVEVSIDEFEPGRANLVARVRGCAPGASVMFNTHLDVVPSGGDWSVAPFDPVVHDGIIYGRGTADAKGSLAAMAACLVWFAKRTGEFVGSVELSGVADEEDGSLGARHLLRTERPDAVIIGEPTELRLMAAHKGSLRPVVEVVGRASHAAQPQHGINAIEGAALLLQQLRAMRQWLAARTHPLVGSPTVVPVGVTGGEAPNMVPERCRVTFDRRMVPGETEQDVVAEFEELFGEYRSLHPEYDVRIVDLAPSTGGPSETHPDDPFVRACQAGLGDLGLPGQLSGLVVNCDMTHFRQQHVPAVVCGPGSPEVMHARDEHLHLDALDRAVDAYRCMALRALGARR